MVCGGLSPFEPPYLRFYRVISTCFNCYGNYYLVYNVKFISQIITSTYPMRHSVIITHFVECNIACINYLYCKYIKILSKAVSVCNIKILKGKSISL